MLLCFLGMLITTLQYLNNYITIVSLFEHDGETMTPNKFLKDKPCIYGIRNIINGKIYVGKSKCMYRRCSQYLRCYKLNDTSHCNRYLLNAFLKQGLENFEMFPLEFCTIGELSDRELYWIEYLKTTDKRYGYNLRIDSSTGMVTHEDTSKLISENITRQWQEGLRDEHSEKMKKRWAEATPERRAQQAEIMRKGRTKWEYTVTNKNGLVEVCDYQRLKELGLSNATANFHRNQSDECMCKGCHIIRKVKGE